MFTNRVEAGRALAKALERYRGQKGLIVLGLPRGGVPVANEVARALGAELDVVIVRKLGVPFQPELAMGAIASGGALYTNTDVVAMAGVTREQFERVRAVQEQELLRREKLYRGDRAPLQLKGRMVIVVDDGMATGATMHVALLALRALEPAKLVAAVPVAPLDSEQRLQGAADEFVCLSMPEGFYAVGQFYRQFGQTSDDEVRELLKRDLSSQ